MELMEAIRSTHSVRQYTTEPIAEDIRLELNEYIDQINSESGLNIITEYDNNEAFNLKLIHYGFFKNVNIYNITVRICIYLNPLAYQVNFLLSD